MSETNVTPAPTASNPATSAAAVPAVGELAKEPVGGNAVAGGSEPTEAANKELERRAANLARAKRESAKNLQERQRLDNERAAHAEDLKAAAEYRRLQKIREEGGDYALSKELKFDWAKGSRAYIEETTGQGKNPIEAAKEAARQVAIEEREKAEKAAAEKAAAEDKQRQQQALAGAKRQLAAMFQADPKAYELSLSLGDLAVGKAWKLIEDYHAQYGQILDFKKAIDAVETDLEARVSKSEKLAAAYEKSKAAAAEAAKAKPKERGVVTKHVETEEAPQSPSTTPTKRPRPMDVYKLAKSMGLNHKAAQDN